MTMRKFYFFCVSMVVCVAAMAQWVQPVPKYGEVVYGDTLYLYNIDAKGFFLGANYYDTRASVSASKGYKCVLTLDEETGYVTIADSVETNSDNTPTGMWYLWASGVDNIWVDYHEEGNIYWRLVQQGDGSYYIYNQFGGLTDYPLGVDLSSGNTSLLFLTDPEAPEVSQVRWGFVTMADYAAFQKEVVVYDAAMLLGSRIEEAQGYGLNTDAAKTVYDNTASTLEQIEAASAELVAAINDYKEHDATPDNPKDLTETYIPDADFEQNQGAGVWLREQSPNAQNWQTGGTPGKQGDATYFLEAWNGSNFKGKIYLPIKDLPNGVYSFTLSAFTNAGEGSYVYAGNDSVEAKSADMTPYTVFTRVMDGTLEVGFKSPKAMQNWIGIDDAKLLYLGNSVASYAYWVSFSLENAPRYDDDAFVQTAAREAYNQLLDTDPSTFATVEEVLAYYDQFTEALASMEANAEAYARYAALLADVEDLQAAGYAGDDADVLYDYVQEEAEDIVRDKALSTEEMTAECDKLSEMIETVKRNCLVPGMDCTKNLVNPNFDDRLNGWSHDSQYADGAWGGLESNPCVERWNDNFDFYQIISGMPNGVYELRVQGFYRPLSDTKASWDNFKADPETDEVLAFIYANKSEAKIKNIADQTPYPEPLEDNYTQVEDGLYLPNGMKAASNVFSRKSDGVNPDYDNAVLGVVTDGTLRVGIKSTTGTKEGRWTLWDNFRLTYVGMDKDAIDGIISTYAEEAEELLEQPMSAVASGALSAASVMAEDAETGDEAFAALTALINAISDAKASISTYEQLEKAISTLEEAVETFEKSPAADQANKLLSATSEAYDEGAYSDEEVAAKVSEIEDMCARLRVPDYANASDDTPIDFTQVIVNPSFETGDMTGWTAAKGDDTGVKDNSNSTYTISNADGGYVFNTWKNAATFDYDVVQTIKFLPAGTYELTALMASNQGNKVSLGANGGSVEFTMTNSLDVADEGSIIFKLGENETLVIKAFATNWFKVDNFHLTYFGANSQKDPNSIECIETISESVPAAIYTVNGAKVATMQKGINIVRMANGQVKKVFIK